MILYQPDCFPQSSIQYFSDPLSPIFGPKVLVLIPRTTLVLNGTRGGLALKRKYAFLASQYSFIAVTLAGWGCGEEGADFEW